MNVASIIDEIQSVGGRIEANNGKLMLRAPSPLPDDLLRRIRINKPKLLETLRMKSESGVHGIPISELRELAGDDWEELHENLDTLDSFAHAVATRRMRESGQRPTHYTQRSECAGCGLVWLWEGAPEYVQGCPWCFNRVKGVAVPKPRKQMRVKA